jgi:hypothetical protein
MIKNIAAGAALALALGACTVLRPEEKMAPVAQAEGVELTKQQGGRFIAFVGPKRQHTQEFLGVTDTNYFALRSWYDNKTADAAHQLYIEDSYYGGPYNWDGVHDAEGKALKFIPISRNQVSCDQGCAYADEFAAELPEDYLRDHQAGLSITFTAGDGKTLPVAVPGDLVVEELAAVDTVRAVAAKAAANASASSPAVTATAAPAAASVPTVPPPAK